MERHGDIVSLVTWILTPILTEIGVLNPTSRLYQSRVKCDEMPITKIQLPINNALLC